MSPVLTSSAGETAGAWSQSAVKAVQMCNEEFSETSTENGVFYEGATEVRAYGLRVESKVPLPLPASEGGTSRTTVRITEGKVKFPPGADGNVADENGSLYLRISNAGTFRIDGTSVIVNRSESVSDWNLSTALLGRVMPALLYSRGHLVVHGSAAAIGETGVAIIGFETSGKSSLAAGLYDAGHRAVADDAIVVNFDGEPSLVPSFPRLKLTEPTLGALDLSENAGDPGKKWWFPVDDGFEPTPVSLDSVFVLKESTDAASPSVAPVAPRTAMEALLRHAGSVDVVRATQTERRHFQECARVAEATDVKRLYRPDDLSQLPELVQTVEDALD
jgi:hypothetical protein